MRIYFMDAPNLDFRHRGGAAPAPGRLRVLQDRRRARERGRVPGPGRARGERDGGDLRRARDARAGEARGRGRLRRIHLHVGHDGAAEGGPAQELALPPHGRRPRHVRPEQVGNRRIVYFQKMGRTNHDSKGCVI